MTNKPLDKKDILRQSVTPTIMVPRETELVPCKPGNIRFLMGSDGLYFDTCTGWGGFTRSLWRSPRPMPLPYGNVEEYDSFSDILYDHVLPLVQSVMLREAAEYAERKNEWAALVLWNGSEFVPHTLEMKTSALNVTFHDSAMASIPPGHEIVADIHSHHVMAPDFSTTDNESDSGRIKIAIVLGNYRSNEGAPAFDWIARYCAHGFFFDPPLKG